MHPILLDLGPATIYTYGVLLAAAYLLGLKLAMVRAKVRDLDEARAWLTRAAAQGHPIANWELARAYETGIGVPADNQLALNLYEAAAVANQVEAIQRMQQISAVHTNVLRVNHWLPKVQHQYSQ